MKKYLFHHLADLPGADEIFAQQIIRIINSKILDDDVSYHICINGSSDQFQSVIDEFTKIYKPTVTQIANDCKQYEYPTLEYLRQTVHTLNQPAAIGYIHLKGAGRPWYKEVADWRRLMEFFIIDNYNQCVKQLDRGYNIVGCNWTPVSWIKPHFSGNFWWAHSEYLKTLRPLLHPTKCIPGLQSFFTGQIYDAADKYRFDCECWIASGDYKHKEMHGSGIIHYHGPYPEDRYINTVFES